MKKIVTIAIASTLCLTPMVMQAQSTGVDFSQYGGAQILNSDFEDWSGPDYDNVPVGWHSFESVGGGRMFVAFARSTDHTSVQKEDLHKGTTGKSCLKLVPRNLGVALANGTISTGQMIAGDFSADSPKNHAQMDISVSESSNGTPFYAKLTQRPIALSVWVKFTQGTPQAEFPYATVSAAITNGSYYQEPTADNDSSAVIGYAQNNTIATNGGEWQHLYVPFRYDSKNFNKTDEPKAIMVTFSTNAKPGKGSDGDVLLIDDLELIYAQTVTILESGYAMLANVAMDKHNVVVPKGLKAYTLTSNGIGEPLVKNIYEEGQVLPYHAAVLLEGKPGDYEFRTTLYEKEENVVTDEDFCLVRGGELNTPTDEYRFFRLMTNNGVLGFYPVTAGLKIQDKEALLRVKAQNAADKYQYVLVPPKKKGDINGDGLQSIVDVMIIVDRLLGRVVKGQLLIPDIDVNGDNNPSVVDVMTLVSIVLGN